MEPRPSGVDQTLPPLLEVDSLRVEFLLRRGTVHAVRDVSFAIRPGESVALVGESGCGKSVTAMSVMGLLKLPGRIAGGDIRWEGKSLLGKEGGRYARSLRGRELAIVFQDPMTSLNPMFTVGMQITEVLRKHMGMNRKQATERAIDLLDLVGIASPARRLDQYPHEFSGGMRQRTMIAIALACEPKLLIADEPTTALDVTIQAQILELIADVQDRMGLSVLLITHDLGVVAGVCQRVDVMYAGKIVESNSIDALFGNPQHPYTQGLLRSTPRLDMVQHRLNGIPGSPPDLLATPLGCAFRTRCSVALERCEHETPELASAGETGKAACWRCSA